MIDAEEASAATRTEALAWLTRRSIQSLPSGEPGRLPLFANPGLVFLVATIGNVTLYMFLARTERGGGLTNGEFLLIQPHIALAGVLGLLWLLGAGLLPLAMRALAARSNDPLALQTIGEIIWFGGGLGRVFLRFAAREGAEWRFARVRWSRIGFLVFLVPEVIFLGACGMVLTSHTAVFVDGVRETNIFGKRERAWSELVSVAARCRRGRASYRLNFVDDSYELLPTPAEDLPIALTIDEVMLYRGVPKRTVTVEAVRGCVDELRTEEQRTQMSTLLTRRGR